MTRGADYRSGAGVTLRRSPRALVIAVCVGLAACTTYHPRPLPQEADLARPPAPDVARLRAAAAELRHPVLRPLQVDLSDGLSPGEAAVLAVLGNPGLVAERDRRGEAAAQLVGAGVLPNPVLNAEADHPYGVGSEGTVNATNLGLEQPLDALVTRSARVAAASAGLEAVDLEIAWSEWGVAQKARLTAQRVGWLVRRVAIVEGELAAERATAATLEAAMQQGDATLQDVGVERAAVAGLQASHDELARAAAEARGELNALLGLPQGFSLEVVDPGPAEAQLWSELPAVDDLVEEALDARLDLAALRRGYDAQEDRVRAAVLAQFPSFSVGVVQQRNETALKFLGGFVTLGLPLFDRNQGAIAGERATRSRLRDEYVARVAAVRVQVHTLHRVDGLLGRQLEAARTTVARLAKVERGERAAVVRGDVDRLTYQTVRTALADARLRLAALAQDRTETRTALETEAGGLLFSDQGETR